MQKSVALWNCIHSGIWTLFCAGGGIVSAARLSCSPAATHRVHDAAHGVALARGAVRVELAALVAGRDADLCEV
jgi:hypothetical protein